MALFESYERRIDKINEVLNSYGIASLEEAEKITKDAGLEVYDMIKGIQPILQAQPSPSRKAAEEPQTLQQPSERAFSPSVFRVLLLTSVK